MPKIVDYAERREDIAKKTMEIIVQDGLASLSYKEIAALCGFGRTTLYRYFKNIPEIIDYLLEKIFSNIEADVDTIQRKVDLKPLEKLYAIIEYMENIAINDKNSMRLVLDFILHPQIHNPSMKVDARLRLQSLRLILENAMIEAINDGSIVVSDPKSMSITLFGLVESATMHSALYNDMSIEKTIENTRTIIEGFRIKSK